MPSVANTVVVHNRTRRAYFIGDVQVDAGSWGRVDGNSPFLAELVSRGNFRICEEAPQPAVVIETQQPETEPAQTSAKKSTAKTSNKGDE